ncbi:hypothetical protein Hte_005191 [Hypoxylon texense]
MDPASAIGVAAAAMQFAELTFKVTKRIAVFTILSDASDDVEGPKAFVESLRNQLRLLNHAIRRIEEGLTSNQDKFQSEEILELGEYVTNLNRQGEKLDELLNKYLPSDDASTPTKLLAALKSIATDVEIKSVMDRIKELHPLLTTFLLTSIAFKDRPVLDVKGVRGTGTENDRQQPRLGTIYQVSRYEVRHFVDRPRVLAQIDRLLRGADTHWPKIAILQGMGGQGKTQLALRYCGNARFRNTHDCIFWIDASTKASTIQGLEKASEELNNEGQVLLDSDARAAFVRRKLAADTLKWLLVFDNYDDPTAFDLRDYIPSGPLGNVLITSRSTDTDRIGPMVHVSGMTESEAIELLFKQLDILNDGKDQVSAAKIVTRLGYLPLAIDQAGAYMKAECLPLVEFLDHYEQSARDILESVPSLWEYNELAPNKDGETTADVVAKTVFTTWNLSFTLLKPSTPIGAMKVTVLSLLAFFGHGISEKYFETYYSTTATSQQAECMALFTDEKQQWSSRKFDSVMREFSRLSLITSIDTERRDAKYALVYLHPLVRDWINLRQDIQTHKANFITFTRILGASLSSGFWEDSHYECGFRMSFAECRHLERHLLQWKETFERHRPNLRPTIAAPERDGVLAGIAAEQLIAYFLTKVLIPWSYEIFQWLWESCDMSDGRMLRIKIDAGNQVVNCLWRLGRTEEAKAKSRENYQFWKAILGDDCSSNDILHTSFTALVNTLIVTISMQDKREIIDLCKCELERIPNDAQNLPKRHELLGSILDAGRLLHQKDIRDWAFSILLDESGFRCSNAFRKEIWCCRNWYAVTQCCVNFSNDLDLMERLTKAAVEWAMDKFGLDFENTSEFLILRAIALKKIGRSGEAEAMIRDHIATTLNTGHADYLIYGRLHEGLGDVLCGQGRYEESYEAFNFALVNTQKYHTEAVDVRLLQRCGEAAMEFNVALADTHFTARLQLLKKTEQWDWIVEAMMVLYGAKLLSKSETASQDALDLMVEGLEVYGLAVVYGKSSTPQEPLREIKATINLEDSDSVPSPAEDEAVYELLSKRISRHYGFELLIRMAPALLRATAKADAAERAYQIAKITFEKMLGTDSSDVNPSIFVALAVFYTSLRFDIDGDKQRVQDTLEWAQPVLRKYEDRRDGFDYWWEPDIEGLSALIRAPLPSQSTPPKARRRHRVASKMIQRLSSRFSRVVSFDPPGFPSSQSDLSLQHGLGSAYTVASSVARPATLASRNRGISREV